MTATTHSSTWLIFRIGRVACAVPALAVDSILPLPEHITAVPGADAGNPGLFHHSSGTVAVIDLRHRFGCEAPDLKRGRLLLGHVGSRGYGFWVDGVVGLADADQVKPAPLPPELPHNVFTAALRHHDEIVLCSDLARLLAMRDAGGLRHLVCAAPPATAASATAEAARPEPRPTPPVVAPGKERAHSTEPAPTITPTASPTSPVPPIPPRRIPPDRPATAAPERPVIRTTPTPAASSTTARNIPLRSTTPRAAPATAPARAAPASLAPSPARPGAGVPAPAPAISPMEPIPPAPASAPSRPWLLLLLAAGLAAGGIWLWPVEQSVQPPRAELPVPAPVPAYVAAAPEPEPQPEPATPAAAPAATPLFQGDGIQVEQNGADITIIIDRARTEPGPPAAVAEASPPPESEADAGAVAEAGPTVDAPLPPAPEPAPPTTSAPQQMYVHTVVRGDTLWDIAERYLDDPWRYKELAQLSRIRNPDLIYPGNKVRIIIR